jgi:hypothetical protein
MSIHKANGKVWCDYCKDKWGKNKDGSWHEKAQVKAWVTIASEGAKSKGQVRHYCHPCVREGEKAVGLTLIQQVAHFYGQVELVG